jgi:threonine aldolase
MALEDGPKLLKEDHDNAKSLARGLAEIPGVGIDIEKVQTNIVIFDISGTGKSANEICAKLLERGVLAIGFGNFIRMVTHRDVSSADIETTIGEIKDVLS